MPAPKKVDYERIEPDWRAGVKSPPQLAAEYTAATGVAVSHTAIIKHFKKLGVTRNLLAKVQAKADSMVLEAMVSGKVSTATNKRDAEIILDGATVIATVRIAHRQDITRSRKLCMTLLAELETQTGNLPELQALGEMLRSPDDNGADKLNDIYRAVISLPERTKTMKALAESLKNLVGMEREAFNIDAATPETARALVDFYSIPPAERQAAYLKLVSGT